MLTYYAHCENCGEVTEYRFLHEHARDAFAVHHVRHYSPHVVVCWEEDEPEKVEEGYSCVGCCL